INYRDITQQDSILFTPVEYLKGVGPLRAELLRKELDICVFGDLLQHFPLRYIDSAQIHRIAALSPDQEYVQLRGVITHISEEGKSFKKRLSAVLSDNSGSVELIWFQGINFVLKTLQPNTVYSVMGKLTWFNGQPTISHPEIEAVQATATQRTT